MNTSSEINEKCLAIFPDIVDLRREIHANPELSFLEKETSKLLIQFLNNAGIKTIKCKNSTGFFAEIKGYEKGRTIALRSDMDALPLQEQNNFDYKSQKPGVMHACGHDIHAASLVGTAITLYSIRDQFNGKIICLFQPGEEKIPGGAISMMHEKYFQKEKPDYVLAQHVHPQLAVGTIGIKSDMYMSSVDDIHIKISGRGGHAATPDLVDNMLLHCSNLIHDLNHVIETKKPKSIPSILVFGKLIAEGSTNIIPGVIELHGTFRTMDETWRIKAHQIIAKSCAKIARKNKIKINLNIENGYPFLKNDRKLSHRIKKELSKIIATKKIINLKTEMIAEDFAYFTQKFPSVMYRLGTANINKKNNFPLHSPLFNPNEESLLTGMQVMSHLSYSLLTK